jgi:NAD(P)-dependent dehydrogenase (short-subunit alcohol dehydrogenase family)
MPDLRSFSLEGKVVIQFGGSGLLGRALVASIAEAGATLIVASRNPSVLTSDAETATKAGLRVFLETVDLLDEASIQSLVARVAENHGPIHGMVYNAVTRTMASMDDALSKWEESMRVNATGFFAAARACGNALAAAGRGSIVNISSQMGTIGPNYFLYEGTGATVAPDYFFHKGGMTNLTRYLASHYGSKGVRVNVVSPGGIYNPAKPQAPDFLARYAKMTMLGRMAEAREIGGAVVFLLSDASTYITGANLAIDGGYTAK